MRTHRKMVTFTRPFALTGVEGIRPAGTYAVETEEEQLPVLLSSAFQRTTTFIFLPLGPPAAGVTQCIAVDPVELDAALRHDVAVTWSLATEGALHDLLKGDVMRQAVQSAGLTIGKFKEQLRDLSGRLGQRKPANDE